MRGASAASVVAAVVIATRTDVLTAERSQGFGAAARAIAEACERLSSSAEDA